MRDPSLMLKQGSVILLAYDIDEFGYNFYGLITKKVIQGKNVGFVEEQTLKDIDNGKKPIVQPSDDSSDFDITPATPIAEYGRVKAQHNDPGEDGTIDPAHD
ncbi:hypothetical protein PIB30_069362 [Stylosanthes scabra]|uniref:Uncharacterized protein n=1 Tax=Stylosanthes scabra TaxID=79078 RepID=A0ABU6RNE6_9FABA|nr:hypothetical protein [Stylosanthes scabra]